MPETSATLLCSGVKLILMSKVHCVLCLKIVPQRGEGEKRENVQILKQSTQNLSHQNYDIRINFTPVRSVIVSKQDAILSINGYDVANFLVLFPYSLSVVLSYYANNTTCPAPYNIKLP